MKRILFLSAIVIAMLMASCSSDGYKSYIPGDSKIIGKIDLKQFFAQTGVNQEKLMNDLHPVFELIVDRRKCQKHR